jgi:hypothetical protein
MAQSYRVRVTKNQVINGQHLTDDMEIRMQTKNGMNPLAYKEGQEEVAQRLQTMYGIDIKKAGLNMYNLKVEKV